jgi:hypothetical protein
MKHPDLIVRSAWSGTVVLAVAVGARALHGSGISSEADPAVAVVGGGRTNSSCSRCGIHSPVHHCGLWSARPYLWVGSDCTVGSEKG